MIPVLGLPVLNRHDLMQRMFDSIDYGPIDRLFIIDNSSSIDRSKVRWPTHVNRIHVADPGYNTGVAAGWNMIIRANIHADWWLICNNDMILEPGVLAKVVDNMVVDKPRIVRVAMGNESWGNHFGAFAVNGALIDTAGWFDENLIPIYFEDTDYIRRLFHPSIVDEISIVTIPSTTHHDGNRSWADQPTLAAANKVSWQGNVEYFDRKWLLIDNGDDGVVNWAQPSVERIRAQDWHIERRDNVKDI